MNHDPDSVKQWLTTIDKDRNWLAEEVGVSKRTLDNWFASGFPLYAQKSITRIAQELEAQSKEVDDAFNLSARQWKELSRRAKACGYEDEIEYLNDFIREEFSKESK